MQRKRQAIGFGLGIALLTALVASSASAQCAFPHGQNTGAGGWARLTQAFVPCNSFDCDGAIGPNVPNDSTAGGIPSCSPPETYHQRAGSPNSGWVLDTVSGRGRLRFDQLAGPTDVRIRLQLRDVRDGTGVFPTVGTTGALYLVIRLTFDDTLNGDMTVIDSPISIPVVIGNASGDANVNTTLNALLIAIGQPPLPSCSNFEVIDGHVLDPAGNKFLRLSHFHL